MSYEPKIGDKVWYVNVESEEIGSGILLLMNEYEATVKAVGFYHKVSLDHIFESEKDASGVLANNLTHKVSRLQKRIRQLESVS